MNEYFFGNPAAIIAQWPLETALVTLFYTFVHILPGNLIRCYIFRKYLRYPMHIVLVGLAFLLLLEAFCQVLYGHIVSSRRPPDLPEYMIDYIKVLKTQD